MSNNTKKYASLESLQIFKENSDILYATQESVDNLSANVANKLEASDYVVDNALSPTSTNPVQNKVLDAEFEAMSVAMNVLKQSVDEKANASHIHSIGDVTNLQSTIDEIHDNISQKSQVQMITSDNLNNTTEILSTFKIHKLTQEQYEEAVANGTLEDNVVYLTPEEEVDLSGYATIEQLYEKADANHSHDDVYYTETEIDTLLEGKANASHNHDEEYDAKGVAAEAEQNAKNYIDGLVGNYALNEHTHTVSNITDFDNNVNILIEAKGYADAIATAKQESITIAAADATTKVDSALVSAKSYADSVADNAANAVKNDLLNGAGEAYDTLKELGDLINENVNAIEALETVASGKADASHNHNSSYDAKGSAIEALSSAKTYTDNAVAQRTQVQIVTWEDND